MSVTVIATGFGPEATARPAPPATPPARRALDARPESTPFERPPSFDTGDLDIPPFIRQPDE